MPSNGGGVSDGGGWHAPSMTIEKFPASILIDVSKHQDGCWHEFGHKMVASRRFWQPWKMLVLHMHMKPWVKPHSNS